MSKAKNKSLARLLQKKERYEAQEFLAEGTRLCQELLASELHLKAIVFTDRLLEQEIGQTLLDQAQAKGCPVWHTDEDTLKRMSDTEHPQPIMVCAQMRSHTLTQTFFQGRRFVVLLDITDPGNVGTLLRSAEGFGWNGVICMGNTTDLYNPKVLRASMGSAFRLPIAYGTEQEVLSFLEDTNVSSVVSTPHGGMVPPFESLPEKLALILGNEAHGVSSSTIARSHLQIKLPMSPQVESLNVAVAGGILLFLLR